MSRPVQEVLARIAQQAPNSTPDLPLIRHRAARRRTARRLSAAGATIAAAVVAVAGTALVGALPQDRDDVVATGPSPAEAIEQRTFVIVVGPGERTGTVPGLDACLALPGAGDLSSQDRRYTVTYTGRPEFTAAADCLKDVPGSYVYETFTRPPVDMPAIPGHPEDVRSVRICSSADAFECHTTIGPEAVELAQEFATARPLDPRNITCRSLTDAYYVLFEHPSLKAKPITVLPGCSPIEVAGRRYGVPDALRRQVRELFERPTTEVATIVSQCVGYDRPQPLVEYVGLTTEAATRRAQKRGLTVQVLGETGPCFEPAVGRVDGRLTLVANSGKVLYAAIG